MIKRLFRILVPSVVPEPDIISLLNKAEWQTQILVDLTDPYFRVHQQAMVEIHYRFVFNFTAQV